MARPPQQILCAKVTSKRMGHDLLGLLDLLEYFLGHKKNEVEEVWWKNKLDKKKTEELYKPA